MLDDVFLLFSWPSVTPQWLQSSWTIDVTVKVFAYHEDNRQHWRPLAHDNPVFLSTYALALL